MLAMVGLKSSARAREFSFTRVGPGYPYSRTIPEKASRYIVGYQGRIAPVWCSDFGTDRANPLRLWYDLEYDGPNSLSVTVHYDSPFQYGEVSIFFRTNYGCEIPKISYEPLASAVTEGIGQMSFHVQGKGGLTNWLFIRLLKTSERSPHFPVRFPHWTPRGLQQGEYNEGDFAIWRVAEFHKVWPA